MTPRRLSERLPRGLPSRILTTVLFLVVVVLVSGLVAISPLALDVLGAQADNWEHLSLIGQTYGAASTLLSVLALIGVAISLVLQAREAKSDREQTLRMLHTDLMKMAMEDPLYRRAWGPFFESDDSDIPREHMYVNLIISQWSMEYELGAITEDHLRSIARVLFSGPAGRRYWTNVRDLRVTSTSTRRERRFHRILDEEFRATGETPPSPPAASSPPPPPPPPSPSAPSSPPDFPAPLSPPAVSAPPAPPAAAAFRAPLGRARQVRPALLALTLLAVPAAVEAARRAVTRQRTR
ncbi:hypothetical protein GCM10010156_03360 [Planobispora rosea]|uniref:Uncharacterized protein n=1 Tax=Planobispora rosea TaxID=35762 RepID=A0A8J3RSG1_PLARO|nr:DUF6082 family protein [Planobispora rosea]GGS47925.1 hypothetical protein GCM10010156_03360 [Planobispora rosea]GIH82151.1 hypothetical protein Pro02_05590 [Planobispora rosea]